MTPPVELFHWNPVRPRYSGRLGKRIPLKRRLNNFGDLLGPRIVNEILLREQLHIASPETSHRLLSVGSILHFARFGDTVWGSGINGKKVTQSLPSTSLDVRAVRGPYTRKILIEQGISVPEVYGDPGLLVGVLWPHLQETSKRHKITVVMNFNDKVRAPKGVNVLDPRSPLEECLRQISSSHLVVGSSLHGIVVAESFGVPARLIRSSHEPPFKYDDYYAGTGRFDYTAADSIGDAIELGGEELPSWSSEALMSAFPRDLWTKLGAH